MHRQRNQRLPSTDDHHQHHGTTPTLTNFVHSDVRVEFNIFVSLLLLKHEKHFRPAPRPDLSQVTGPTFWTLQGWPVRLTTAYR